MPSSVIWFVIGILFRELLFFNSLYSSSYKSSQTVLLFGYHLLKDKYSLHIIFKLKFICG